MNYFDIKFKNENKKQRFGKAVRKQAVKLLKLFYSQLRAEFKALVVGSKNLMKQYKKEKEKYQRSKLKKTFQS